MPASMVSVDHTLSEHVQRCGGFWCKAAEQHLRLDMSYCQSAALQHSSHGSPYDAAKASFTAPINGWTRLHLGLTGCTATLAQIIAPGDNVEHQCLEHKQLHLVSV